MRERASTTVMFTLFLIATFAFSIVEVLGHSSDVMVAVYGSTPAIDGSIETEEWNDAYTVTFSVTDNADCTIYAKQDGVNFYVGFNIPDDTYNGSDGCVIIFDVNHEGSTLLQPDDTWITVARNGVKKEHNVSAGGWFPTTISGWAVQTSSASDKWQCEYNITYSKIDVIAGTNKSLGVMFVVIDKDVEMGWYVCPSKASISNPATWGDISSNGYNWIPEFSSWTQVLFLLITLSVVIAVCRRRLL